MGNCVNQMGHEWGNEDDWSEPLPWTNYYSLRDPDNLPHATWSQVGEAALGRHNGPVKPQYHPYLDQLGVEYIGPQDVCPNCRSAMGVSEGYPDCQSCGHRRPEQLRLAAMTRAQRLQQAQAHEAQYGPDISAVSPPQPDSQNGPTYSKTRKGSKMTQVAKRMAAELPHNDSFPVEGTPWCSYCHGLGHDYQAPRDPNGQPPLCPQCNGSSLEPQADLEFLPERKNYTHIIEARLAKRYSMSMTQHTGFPELDKAIEEFIAANSGPPLYVNDFRSPSGAWGACEEAADAFAAFLKQRGFKAYSCADELTMFPGYENAQDSKAIGAGDFSYPEHAVVEVYGLYGENDVRTITIDFTAAQYGYTEFPKVEPPYQAKTAASDIGYDEHPLRGDAQLEQALFNDLGRPAHELRYRPVTLSLRDDLDHLVQHPEDYLVDGDEDGYETAMSFHDAYAQGDKLAPITVSRPLWSPSQYQLADGWHRLAGAYAAQVPMIDGLEAYDPSKLSTVASVFKIGFERVGHPSTPNNPSARTGVTSTHQWTPGREGRGIYDTRTDTLHTWPMSWSWENSHTPSHGEYARANAIGGLKFYIEPDGEITGASPRQHDKLGPYTQQMTEGTGLRFNPSKWRTPQAPDADYDDFTLARSSHSDEHGVSDEQGMTVPIADNRKRFKGDGTVRRKMDTLALSANGFWEVRSPNGTSLEGPVGTRVGVSPGDSVEFPGGWEPEYPSQDYPNAPGVCPACRGEGKIFNAKGSVGMDCSYCLGAGHDMDLWTEDHLPAGSDSGRGTRLHPSYDAELPLPSHFHHRWPSYMQAPGDLGEPRFGGVPIVAAAGTPAGEVP